MTIEVRFLGMNPSAALRDHARRLGLARLARFGPELRSIVLRIGDVNGPKGGVDKRCFATVRGPRVGVCAIEETSGDFYSAVEKTIDRIAETTGRTIERLRSSRRRHAVRAAE